MVSHRFLIALGSLLMAGVPAWGHNLLVEARVLPFWQIQVESWYETGEAPRQARLVVRRADGTEVLETRLDDDGSHVWECREAGPLQVVVTDGLGHRAETTIPAERLTLRSAETLALCLTPPPSLLPVPLLAPPPSASLPMVAEVPVRPSGPPIAKLLLGVAILLAVAGGWLLWSRSRTA